jgi:F-type H+-transporting ATPase subunit epsilon
MAGFKLNLYTPKGTVVSGLVCDDIVVPTCRGEINLLPNHTHILTELATGVLVAKSSSGTRHYSVTAGLCRVMNETVSIISFTSEAAQEVDLERAKSAKAKAQSRLSGQSSLSEVELIKFRRKLERAEMRIRLANLK